VQYRAALALAKNDPDLQQTVADLSSEVEPVQPAHVVEGLSFEQAHELLNTDPSPAVPPEPDPIPPAAIIPPPDSPPLTVESVDAAAVERAPERESDDGAPERARQTIAALEQWLDAIHVSRTQPRA
jgi:hypothetical protein